MVRQKKDRNKFYKRREGGKMGGWVDDPQDASVWTTYQGPHQVLAKVGKENAEIVNVTGLMQEGVYDTIYIIRHKITGDFVANRKHRNRGIFYSKRWDDAGIWTRPHHCKALIRAWESYCKHPSMVQYNLSINKNELQIIKLPVFVPPAESI